MANRHERRKAEAVRKKHSAMAERHEQMREMVRRSRQTGATIGESPDPRVAEPRHGEIK